MTDRVDRLARRRARTDVVATVVGATALVASVFVGREPLLVAGVYALVIGTSTGVVTYCLTRFTGILIDEVDPEDSGSDDSTSERPSQGAWAVFTGKALETDADVEVDTGWLIGRLENVLVLTLVVTGQYTALSIIFAAKSWVRREDTATENTTYYLAGTLVNFTYSILAGLALVWATGTI